MPYAPPRPCSDPTCGKLNCKRHTGRRRHELANPRGSSTAQGYGAEWRRLRLAILARDPFCREPSGCTAASVDVDHIVPRRQGGSDHPDNLRGMCKRHHSRKTALEDGRWGHR